MWDPMTESESDSDEESVINESGEAIEVEGKCMAHRIMTQKIKV